MATFSFATVLLVFLPFLLILIGLLKRLGIFLFLAGLMFLLLAFTLPVPSLVSILFFFIGVVTMIFGVGAKL